MIQLYVEELERQIEDEDNPITSEKALVALIGNFVANKLGGPTDNWRVSN
jgi:hypothetical protein